MASRVAVLEEKIENLVSKVDRMRKRRTELQAKVQAAEDRAAAAEAALAASVHNANTISTDNEQGSKLKTELEKEKEKVRNRKLEKEKERNRKWEELTVAKDKRQKATIRQPKKVLDKESIKRDAKPRNSQDIAQKHTREWTLINEDLEAQPLAAAGQVSEAFTRISSTQDDMERISKEKNETNYAHAKLIKEHERISNELEKTRAALTRAEKDIEDKTKDIEEIAAARKAAQEGQNAAMDQLMHRLSELEEEAAVSQRSQVEGGELEVLLHEKGKLSEQLQESNTAVKKLQDHCTELQRCLPEFEQWDSQSMDQQTDKDDALDGSNIAGAHDRESLVKSIYDLKFWNEYLKAQVQSFHVQNTESGSLEGYIEQSKETCEEISLDALRNLEKQISDMKEQLAESRVLRTTAEDHMKQFQLAWSESEKKVQDLSAQLVEVRQKIEKEIKEHDERYTELDAKFGRLQKRAKRKIQELQKGKENVEAQLSIVSEKASQAMAQQSAVQEELECTRCQTGEALRSLDGEKQQLRSANSRQKEILEELRQTLEAREHDIEELKQSLSEKDQMLQDTKVSLKAMDEKRQSSLSELATKHQKIVESFESQLADATMERSKAAESRSKLLEDLVDRESKLAELEAASTGEAVRLGVALESAKGEVIRAKQEHQKEKESWEAALKTVKAKLEESEKACLQYEIDAAKTRSELESELAGLQQVLKGTNEELLSSRAEISRLEDDFKAYKNRAHALLQKKDAELSAVKDMDLVAALKDAQRERDLAIGQRDHAQKDFEDSIEIGRITPFLAQQQMIRDRAMELESTKAHLQSQEKAWQRELQRTVLNVQEIWRSKYKALEAQTSKMDEDLNSFRMNYEKLKVEHDSFREMTKKIIEAKDNGISRLLDDNNNLQRSLRTNHLVLARQQAQREEELVQRQ